jgi:hypothetical protein
MSMRAAAIALIALPLLSCGVKSDLERPMGQVIERAPAQVLQSDRRDPSKPPVPLGAPGGTTPPYPTGP